MNPSAKALEEEFKITKKIVLCLTDTPRVTPDGIEILPVEHFLKKLWIGKIIC